jgi:hypothetical protein
MISVDENSQKYEKSVYLAFFVLGTVTIPSYEYLNGADCLGGDCICDYNEGSYKLNLMN